MFLKPKFLGGYMNTARSDSLDNDAGSIGIAFQEKRKTKAAIPTIPTTMVITMATKRIYL
jgi:hypothetical protein